MHANVSAMPRALRPHQGVNIMAFCKEYNAQTAKMAGQIIPVEITVYEVRQAEQFLVVYCVCRKT